MSSKAEQLRTLVESGVSRRQFARNVMTGGLAFGAAGTILLTPDQELHAQSLTDVDILKFALNLEYLEAEFYTVATTGQRISEAGIGVTGTWRAGETVGGSRGPVM